MLQLKSLFCVVFVVQMYLSMLLGVGPENPLARIAVLVVATPMVVIAFVSWFYWGTRIVSLCFAVYCDLALAVELLLFDNRFAALLWCPIFMLLGIYLAYRHGLPITIVHSIFVVVVTSICLLLALIENTYPWQVMVVAASCTAAAAVVGPLAISMIVLDLRRVGSQAFRESRRDTLTGLLNRRGLEASVETIISEMDTEDVVVAMVIDLDKFKMVNDNYGHSAGDEVLKRVATRLIEATPDTTVVARTGGEEFVVLAAAEPDEAITLATECRNRIFNDTDPIVTTASIGVATIERDRAAPERVSTWLEKLLHRADVAMYVAKRAGGDRVCMERQGK